PARHAGWSHYWQPGGPMTVAKLSSNGPMKVASDSSYQSAVDAMNVRFQGRADRSASRPAGTGRICAVADHRHATDAGRGPSLPSTPVRCGVGRAAARFLKLA